MYFYVCQFQLYIVPFLTIIEHFNSLMPMEVPNFRQSRIDEDILNGIVFNFI